MPTAPPAARTLGELRKSGTVFRSLRDEIQHNLRRRLREGEPLFTDIRGYDDTVVPALENALLSGHDTIFLGERGQAKTRMIRALVGLLEEWIPVVAGSEINDDPLAPVSAFARASKSRKRAMRPRSSGSTGTSATWRSSPPRTSRSAT